MTPPVISAVAVSGITPDSATITWTTDEPATSRVDYGLTASYGTVVSDAAPATSHSTELTGLAAATLYHYQVTSVDAAGNPASSADLTFDTPPDTAVDTVTITRARYEEGKSKLDVRADNSLGSSVTLTATAIDSSGSEMGSVTLDYDAKKDTHKGKITGLAFKPFRVEVVSTGGGSDSVQGEDIETK